MASLYDVQKALKTAVNNALNAAAAAGSTFPGIQVGVGEPFGPAMAEFLGQAEAQVTIYAQANATQNRTSRKPRFKTVAPAVVGVTVEYTQGVGYTQATFGGTVTPGLNVHAFVGNPLTDVYFPTQVGWDATALASAAASGINAQHLDGISASSAGAVLTVNGSDLKINIGGVATLAAEVRRMMTPIQVSVWAANPDDRETLAKIIDSSIGIDIAPFIQTPDGSMVWVRLRNSWPLEKSQSSYSLYEAHFIFECEYPTLATTPGTQVEAIGAKLNDGTTEISGG